MCTAAVFQKRNIYFGRNLDMEYSYHEEITVTPRNFPFKFRMAGKMESHYAMIGMAYVKDGQPLYYEAANEKGLGIAGLNFPGNAYYGMPESGKDNIAPFELIWWVLGQCASIKEARALFERINIVSEAFSPELPLSPLHWMVSAKDGSLTLEPMREGLKIYDNKVSVLTNNPPFDYHMTNLINYMNLSADAAENRFSDKLELGEYSKGMGAVGLPGDLSSSSRFIKAAFTLLNSECGDSEEECVSQFFHVLSSVEQQKGCVRLGGGKYEVTLYSSCCSMDRGIYYYKTYTNSRISAVDMSKCELDSYRLFRYPMIKKEDILMQN